MRRELVLVIARLEVVTVVRNEHDDRILAEAETLYRLQQPPERLGYAFDLSAVAQEVLGRRTGVPYHRRVGKKVWSNPRSGYQALTGMLHFCNLKAGCNV